MRRTTGPCRRGLHSLLFSGQGTQHGGMARDLYAAFPAARRVLDAVDDELGFALTALMFDERADGAAASNPRSAASMRTGRCRGSSCPQAALVPVPARTAAAAGTAPRPPAAPRSAPPTRSLRSVV